MTDVLEVAFRATGPEGPAPEAVKVRVAVPEAQAPVAAFFPDYREAADPADATLLLESLDGGGYGVRGRGKHLATPTLSEAVSLLEQRLTEELAGSLPGVRILHGSAVAMPGGALLVPGSSGAGKSTLAAALVARGRPLFGDDVLLLGLEDRRLHPFKRLLKVDERATEILGLDPVAGPLRTFWPDRCFFHPRDLGSTWAEAASLAAVVLPRRRDDDSAEGDRPALRPASGGRAVKEILEQVLLVERVGPEEFLAAADAVADARLLELSYRRSDLAAELLVAELG